ncbi:alpha/beta hydrolase [Methylobacterium sp. C25]|uniref:alpha/beta hydrolase family protein n=1 Tax=Methylobacterium sp. C25 TaxID=2721622 RepID=UPI001F23AEEA|nr:alpha/beta hydrolase [Methylobacterium sp. C25]MCE4225412.1 alpha/beta hydrolase [Methylobacterium sp. C25]
MRLTFRLRSATASLLIALGLCAPAFAAAPPTQPQDGPGGVGDKAATIVKRGIGTANSSTYAFYRSGTAPAEGRPVAVFLHAWGATNPRAYGGWIDHLARNGWLVLFPRFQELNKSRPSEATEKAGILLKSALDALAADPDAKPDTKRMTLIGHLAGAPLAANLAAGAQTQGLPAPKLLYVIMPGGIAHDAKSRGIPLGDLSGISGDTLLVAVTGDKDARAADLAARRILREATAVAPERKLLVRALSDDHGFPAMTATLSSPAGIDAAYDGTAITIAPEPKDAKPAPFKWSPDVTLSGEQSTLVQQINNARADALDYLGYWRTFDMAASGAFAGKDANKLKADSSFSDMGRWADGWPVKRLGVEVPKLAPPAPVAAPAAVAPTTAAARGASGKGRQAQPRAADRR